MIQQCKQKVIDSCEEEEADHNKPSFMYYINDPFRSVLDFSKFWLQIFQIFFIFFQ